MVTGGVGGRVVSVTGAVGVSREKGGGVFPWPQAGSLWAKPAAPRAMSAVNGERRGVSPTWLAVPSSPYSWIGRAET
jgi:hypothetical protein